MVWRGKITKILYLSKYLSTLLYNVARLCTAAITVILLDVQVKFLLNEIIKANPNPRQSKAEYLQDIPSGY